MIGKPIAEARQLIRAAHLQTAAHIVPSYLPAGTVVTQDPSAGAQTVPTLVVSVSVSNGVAPIHTLPDVVGLTSDAATSTLGAIHVFVTVVDQAVKKPSKDGIVLSMDPVGGTKVKEGSSVTLVVGVGPKPPSPSPSPSPSPKPGKGRKATVTGAAEGGTPRSRSSPEPLLDLPLHGRPVHLAFRAAHHDAHHPAEVARRARTRLGERLLDERVHLRLRQLGGGVAGHSLLFGPLLVGELLSSGLLERFDRLGVLLDLLAGDLANLVVREIVADLLLAVRNGRQRACGAR